MQKQAILITTIDHITSIIHDGHEYLNLNISTNYSLRLLERRLQLFWVFGKTNLISGPKKRLNKNKYKFKLLHFFMEDNSLKTFGVAGIKCGLDNGFPIQPCKINQFICCYLSFLMKNRNTWASKNEFCTTEGE